MDMVIIRETQLPGTVNGYASLDENGDYNIYINYDLSPVCQIQTLEHELSHIKSDDFNSFDSVLDIEKSMR